MKQLNKMHSLAETANAGDNLIEGYSLTLDNHEFCVFVFDELTEAHRGYILKIMYGDGTDEDVDLDKMKKYPQVNRIFDKNLHGLWINKGKKRFCYKYIVFGKEQKDRIFAVTIMRQIVCDILMSYPIE
ncbi:MAG: Arm DNA-binding domain-containing protein [Bacteroidales bacterium]|nr:Arm DNA-binding domain-containing protein [Bacteroidales bacterium]